VIRRLRADWPYKLALLTEVGYLALTLLGLV